MTLEELFVVALSPLLSDQLFPVTAPENTPLPYGVYQQIGGIPLNYTGGDIPDRRNARIQLNIWSVRYIDALQLMKQAQDVMRQADGLEVVLDGEFSDASDTELGRYGVRQDFSVWGPR
jgi:hypothetical protein